MKIAVPAGNTDTRPFAATFACMLGTSSPLTYTDHFSTFFADVPDTASGSFAVNPVMPVTFSEPTAPNAKPNTEETAVAVAAASTVYDVLYIG